MGHQEEIGLQQYFEVLWRRKRVIFSVFAVVFVLCVIWISMSDTTYEVNSLIALKNQLYHRQVLLPFAPGSDTPEQSLYGESWVKIINGVPFSEKVASAMTRLPEPVPINPHEVHSSLSADFQDPDLILIHARHVDPNRAIMMANVAADTFVEENVANLRSSILSFADYARSKMDHYQKELREAEAEIARFKEGLGFVNLNDEIQNLKNTIGAFEKEAASVQTQIEIAEARRREIRSVAKLSGNSVLVDEPQIDQLQNLRELLTQARLRYTDKHPVVANLESQIRDIESRVRASLQASGVPISPERYLSLRDELVETEATLADLRTAQSSWDSQIAQLRARLSDFPEKQYQLEVLESRAAEAKGQYDSWREKVDDANSQASTVQGNASIADYATVAQPAISKTTNIALSFIVAALLALGVGFVVEFADSTVRTPEEITRALGLPFLGSIVKMKDARQIVFSQGKGSANVAEAYTKIYSNIKFAAVEGPLHSILVTSARKGEGKSTTLLNLACAVAAAGKRVIVVDTDLRNPTLQRILKTRHALGLTSVLSGECALDEAIQGTEHPGLALLPSGPVPPNPAELLQSTAMRELIEQAEARCDLVIFDTPPTLLVADAMLLAAETDAAILVSQAGGVTRREVQHVRETLEVAKARILGVILNKVADSPGSYYYNYYSYYRYYQEPEEETRAETEGSFAWLRDSVRSLNSRIGGRS